MSTANQAVIQGATWRITVLTERLFRLEQDPAGRFANLPSQAVVNRDFPVPAFTVSEERGVLTLKTSQVILTYRTWCSFSPASLTIEYHSGEIWRYGNASDNPYDKLRGTVRTLDGVDGEIPLPPSLMTRFGFSELDDSQTLLMAPDGSYVQRGPDTVDLYVFGYCQDYVALLKDFFRLTGPTPLLPRYAMGNMWSRYYSYHQDEYLELMDRFEKEGIPLTVGVIDMGWHLDGWTGYTWNPDYFPDYRAFLRDMHKRGLEVTLNLHPATGVAPFEGMYKEMAEAVGQTDGTRILFNLTDPVFRKAYFDVLHHPYEKDGVTFWWIDWQQGPYSAIDNLDPLWLLNDLHRKDMEEQGKRPFMLSRYAGPGAHRYPAGFSGDTVVTWESLKFQPYFTACASNVGFAWWSHDIGGHMGGYRDDELAVRWVQLGVFSPINRLHSTSHPLMGKEPWNYGEAAEKAMKKFLALRARLVPYLYTMNARTAEQGIPLVEPLYYQWPADGHVYRREFRNEFLFGSEMLVSPITEKLSPVTGLAPADTWLPEGLWFDFFSGRTYTGGQRITLCRPLDELPVFVKAGGILPLSGDPLHHGAENPRHMEVHVFPKASSTFSLYEDDGMTMAYRDGHSVRTELRVDWDTALTFTVGRPEGDPDLIVRDRTWTVVFRHLKAGALPLVTEDGAEKAFTCEKVHDGFAVTVPDVNGTLEIRFAELPELLESVSPEEVLELLRRFQGSHGLKQALYDLVVSDASPLQIYAVLEREKADPALIAALTEMMILRTSR